MFFIKKLYTFFSSFVNIRYINKLNFNMTKPKIVDLEKKYMEKIWKIVTNKDFIEDLKKTEKYIKDNYEQLDRNYQIKNKLQLAAERLLSFYVHKNFKITKIYPSPISSDIAFFVKDCLINIDAKTIDLAGNKGDDSFIQFGPHQISFMNEPLYGQKIGDIDFKGVELHPGLPEFEPETKLPCLTFFMGITYEDDGRSFAISHIKLSCVPNGKIVKEEFNNKLIKNFKTYRYLKKEAAQKIGKDYLPINLENAKEHWILFKLNAANTWLDTSLKNPFDGSELSIWRIIDKKYEICLGGDTARIDPNILEKRKDSSGREWMGIKEQKI